MAFRSNRRSALRLGGGALAALAMPNLARTQSAKPLRVVMHAPLRISDPIVTAAWTSWNHGYSIYDTLPRSVCFSLEMPPRVVVSTRLPAATKGNTALQAKAY